MKPTLSILAAFVLSTATPLLSAATVNVEFSNPEKYSDIDYYNGSRVKFRERLFKELKSYLSEEASKILPENYQLSLKVTNIDLAGRYDFVRNEHIRIVRDIDFPRLKFSYQLTKGEQSIDQKEVYLKDMSFLRHNQHLSRISRESFYHEKKLLKDWLKKEIKPLVM